ncbi:primase-helicase family protein [Microvirga solisilvae]|uniref:primase-helicase family protein n=1 Tax=Microvirga solisilvae TaxID=2919498 RepID=UPI001FB01A22|nr:primase-helicase family protein [Microvirga solisilvae]
MTEQPTSIAALIDNAAPLDAELPREKETGPEGENEDSEPRDPRAWGFDVEALNKEYALVLMGSKAVIYLDQPSAPVEDQQRVLTLDAFKAWYSNRYTEIVGNDGKIKAITWANAWLQNRKRRQYRGIEFHPDPNHEPGTDQYLNLWSGFAVEPREKKNGYAIFRDHLLNNVCRGNEAHFKWLFAFFAQMVQNPREKIGVSVVMRGRMGSGKTKVGEVFGSLFPRHYFLVDDPRYVTGQFNAHMATCLLLQADEAVWAGDKAAEGRLKGLVTSPIQQIEAKGIDPIRLKNYVRLIMTSNEDWVVPAGKDERRFCVLDIDPRCAQNADYFREMEEQLADGGREALLYDLLHFDLDSVNLRQIPRTEALLEQKIRSLDSIESWWFERLMAGATTRGGAQWLLEIPKGVLADDYIATSERIGIKRKAAETEIGMKLRKLVPGIGESRPMWSTDARPVPERTWCWRLPSLADCRAAFEESVQQEVQWPHDGENREEPESAS